MDPKSSILAKAMKLTPAEKADTVDQLIKNLNEPDKEIDGLRKREGLRNSIEAFKRGGSEVGQFAGGYGKI